MNLGKKSALSVVLVVGTMSVPAVGFIASPAWSASCMPFANAPYTYGTNQVRGTAGQTCPSGQTTDNSVVLKWDRALHSDPELDERNGTYGTKTWTLSSACVGGSHDYYLDSSSYLFTVDATSPRKRYSC